MNIESVTLSPGQLQRVLAAGNPDAALLYLYLRAGNSPDAIVGDLKLPAERMHAAMAMLRQLGLWSEENPPGFSPENVPPTPSRMCWRPPGTTISAPSAEKCSGCWARV